MESESDVLSREIGKLGGIGARWVARLLPTNTAEEAVTLQLPAASARQLILDLVGSAVLASPAPSAPDLIRAVVGSGRLNLNPTLLTITITPISASTTRVTVRGAAKEGLVRQRGGEQATSRFMGQLASTIAPTQTA